MCVRQSGSMSVTICARHHMLTPARSHMACSAPRMDTNVHFWAFFVVEAAGITCGVPLGPATTWGLGSGMVGTNQPS